MLFAGLVAVYEYVDPLTSERLVTVICSLSTMIVNGTDEGGAAVSVTWKVHGEAHAAIE